MLKISYVGCLGLSSDISSQFTFEMCAAAKNCEKFTKNPLLEVQGRSRSSMLIKFKKPVTSACYDKQHVSCMYLFATVFTLEEPIAAK